MGMLQLKDYFNLFPSLHHVIPSVTTPWEQWVQKEVILDRKTYLNDEHLYTLSRTDFAKEIGKSTDCVKKNMKRGKYKDLYLSGGVVFGTTGGSVSSKTLDDYEEGTWTPTYTGSVTAGTSPTGVGFYTKVGQLVTVTCGFKNVTASGAAGVIQILGYRCQQFIFYF